MDLIKFSIGSPAKVVVGVLFILLFGMIEFYRIPIQLTPDVDKPNATVTTIWPGASPEEIEKEIVDRQEEQLKTLPGLKRMSSTSDRGMGTIVLEYEIGTDLHTSLVEVSNKLDQVKGYPELADRPVITTVDAGGGAMAWFTLKTLPGNERHVSEYRRLCEDVIKPAFERVQGVGVSNIFGGREEQVIVNFDPHDLAARGVSILEMIQAIQRANRNWSAGDLDEGKRRYQVRTLGEFKNIVDIESIVISQQGGASIHLKDVARVEKGWEEPQFSVRHFGTSSIAMNCLRSAGANVLEVNRELQMVVADLNKGILKDQNLKIIQVYDETEYIHSAMELVQNNIWVSGALAIAVLFLFLKSVASVLAIAIAIPISIVGTFLVMSLLGRNLNVISLAGISFAVGMVVDNSIVVLENIYRYRQLGLSGMEASARGTREVWGAVLASTLTTMAVFLPVLFMVEEIGQLYRDIALAVSASVFISLIVSVSAIPAMTSRWMRSGVKGGGDPSWVERLSGMMAGGIYSLLKSSIAKVLIVAVLIVGSLALSYFMKPPADYLPKGNQNMVFGVLSPPTGNNLEELTRMGQIIENEISPRFAIEGVSDPLEPSIKNFFFVNSGQRVFMGAIATDREKVKELMGPLRGAAAKVPGMRSFISQVGLFQRGGTQGRSIKLELKGPDLNVLKSKSESIYGMLMQLFPTSQIRPPDLALDHPEVSVIPDRTLLARAGIGSDELGVMVDVMMDGRKISEINVSGREIDLILKGSDEYVGRAQSLADLPLLGRRGELIHLSSVAEVRIDTGPDKIPHVERDRAITIEFEPPAELPLETAMGKIESEVLAPLKARGELNEFYRVKLSGSAQELTDALESLKWKFIMALVITYLLMAGLFENFAYPLVIMVSVPLAMVGGFAGLALVHNHFPDQNMDTLTMLGFVILTGTVVNNAILLVHQSLNHMREDGMLHKEAIRESVRNRVRPILMCTLTSVFGMLPLVLFPGPGSELYRGLGSVVVGGLLVSTLFTLVLIPCLLCLVLDVTTRLPTAKAGA